MATPTFLPLAPNATKSPRPHTSSFSSASNGLTFLPLIPVHGSDPAGPFLSLAPAVSASYPRMPTSRPNDPQASRRRSSSSSSSDAFRVLKLGPVHWGEHADEHQSDFYDIAP